MVMQLDVVTGTIGRRVKDQCSTAFSPQTLVISLLFTHARDTTTTMLTQSVATASLKLIFYLAGGDEIAIPTNRAITGVNFITTSQISD